MQLIAEERELREEEMLAEVHVVPQFLRVHHDLPPPTHDPSCHSLPTHNRAYHIIFLDTAPEMRRDVRCNGALDVRQNVVVHTFRNVCSSSIFNAVLSHIRSLHALFASLVCAVRFGAASPERKPMVFVFDILSDK